MPGTTTARATATGRTGRRGLGKRRWLLRLGVLAVLVGWLALAGAGGPMVGRLAEVQENDNANFLPENAESTRVNELASQFVDATALPYFDGARAGRRHHRAGPGDGGRVRGLVPGWSSPAGQEGRRLPDQSGDDGAQPGQGPAADSGGRRRARSRTWCARATVLYAIADAMRTELESVKPAGLAAYVTGPGGVFADFVVAFGGIDGILLGVALSVVFVILLIVYRSPILPIAVLLGGVRACARGAGDLPWRRTT